MKRGRRAPTLTVLGGQVDLYMDDGSTLVIPRAYGMAYDPSGAALEKCSLWFVPTEVTQEAIRNTTPEQRKWFGSDYEGRRAFVDVPSDGWELVGRVAEIVYFRPGHHENDWRHPFQPAQPLEMSTRTETGDAAYVLRLPEGCVIDWRGIVSP